MMKNVFEKCLLVSSAVVGVFSMQLGGAWATSVDVVPRTTGTASLDCVSADCAALGYTQSSTDCAGQKSVRCPFDTSKYFCVSSSDAGSTGCVAPTYPMMEYVSDTLGMKTVTGGYEWKLGIYLLGETFPSEAPANDRKWHFSSYDGATILVSCTNGYSFNGVSLGGNRYMCDGASLAEQNKYDLSFSFKCKFKVGSDGTVKEYTLSHSLKSQTYDQFVNIGYDTSMFCKKYVRLKSDGCYSFDTSSSMIGSIGGTIGSDLQPLDPIAP